MMRTIALVLCCSLCLGDARRLQASVADSEEDFNTFGEQQNSQSLIQLVQSAMSPVDKLKYDFLAILRKEPAWKNIQKFFMVTDHLGYSMFGQKAGKWLCKTLRQVRNHFVVKDFKVDFVEDHGIVSQWKDGKEEKESHLPGRELYAQWSVSLNTKKPWFHFGHSDPVLIEGEISFVLNANMQLARVQMKSCFVNGMELMLWPEVQFDGKKSENMKRIREWIELVKEVTDKKAGLYKEPFESVFGVGKLPSDDFEKTVEQVKADFANVFRREPSWDAFAQNLTFTDANGLKVSGLESNQNLFQLLRKVPEKFAVRDFQVQFEEMSEMFSTYNNGKLKEKTRVPYLDIVESAEGTFLVASWRLKLGEKKGIAFWKKDSPLEIEAGTLFQLNLIDDEIKIDRMQLTSVFVNGVQLESWPEVDLLDDLANGQRTVEEIGVAAWPWINSLTRSWMSSSRMATNIWVEALPLRHRNG